MGKTIFKIALLLAVMAMIAVGVSFLFPAKPPPAPKPLPNPNGYDVFVSEGKLLPSRIGDPNKLSHEQLEAFIAANSNALQMARSGFALESRVPLTFTPANFTNHMSEITAIRSLGHAFVADGRLEELNGRTNAAANAYLDTIQLGYSIRQGGLLTDAMMGTAISRIGLMRIQSIRNQIDARTCRNVITRLESSDSSSEGWSEFLERDTAWARYYGSGIRARLYSLFSIGSRKTSLKKAETLFNEQKTEIRKLMISLAARAYELEKGTKPKTVADLVPDYLKAVPVDPVTKSNLTYAP